VTKKIKINVGDETVSGILQIPEKPWCLVVFAHGAGANMEHSFMKQAAKQLEERGIATLRFNFLYMEKGGGRPDLPPVAQSVLRSAVAKAVELLPKKNIPVVGAGKSFGGRMFSQLMATADAPAVSALVYYGFPLHAPGKAGKERAEHLTKVKIPMLFLQGTRDTLADDIDLIREVVKSHKKATLFVVEGADHSFKVPKKSGMTEGDVHALLADTVSEWLDKKVKA
jgi:predicted alpha/beta-hydrolase family hydrolase